MTFYYRGYFVHKNASTGRKVYAAVIQRGGAARRSLRWFLRAREAKEYGQRWADRAARIQPELQPA